MLNSTCCATQNADAFKCVLQVRLLGSYFSGVDCILFVLHTLLYQKTQCFLCFLQLELFHICQLEGELSSVWNLLYGTFYCSCDSAMKIDCIVSPRCLVPTPKREIWPQRPRYFAATIAMQYARGGGTMHNQWRDGVTVEGARTSVGGGLTLVLTWLMPGRGWHLSMGGGG